MDEVTRGARGLIVVPDIRGEAYAMSADERLEESKGLAAAIGIEIAHATIVTIRDVKPATLFGSGQVDALRTACEQSEIELIVVDGALSPIQQRNLEDRLARKVIDRTGLILEIFGERAATAEGRLQVELAHLDYQQSRLVRSWTHLERQRGGFGFLGGPGETQIEADRRMIRQRMANLRKELEQVRKTRALHRERRDRAPWPVISLVGYTNAGKSTLFNRLTGADVMAEDLLFATLDPTMRAISLPGVEKAILSDTVGFVSGLPTQLVAAFRATLEEVIAADVILHVRDMANSSREAQKEQVLAVLRDLGVVFDDPERQSDGDTIPIIEVWNKMDLLPDVERDALLAAAETNETLVPISAQTGWGTDALERSIDQMLTQNSRTCDFEIPATDGKRIAWLHAHGEVLSETEATGPEGEPVLAIKARLNPKEIGQFETL